MRYRGLGDRLGVAWWVRPSRTEVASLRAARDALASNIELLTQRAARPGRTGLLRDPRLLKFSRMAHAALEH
ncbi:MAG: hypothetical protein ACRET0_09685 [Steroidobacteraceae bacterium]